MSEELGRLSLFIAPAAQSDVDAALDWLESISAETANRFDAALRKELTGLAEQWARGVRGSPDEAATLYFSRPVFQHVFHTGQQRRRRSSSGVWRIYYEILDTSGGGQPDTLRVLAVRHAAARPLSFSDSEGNNGAGSSPPEE